MITNDALLLQSWARNGSETAFTELVNRHLSFVYTAARRQVGDDELAKEVAQVVFVVLARKTPDLRNDALLQGWLFRTTRFVALRALRDRARQRRRDHEAYTMSHLGDYAEESGLGWEHLGPHLDAGLASLSEADRQAILLRYFEKQSVKVVAEHLGIGEETGKKRLQRGLEKLRCFLKKRGVAIGAGALGLLMAGMPGAASPVGLAPIVIRRALAPQKVEPVESLVWAALSGHFYTGWPRMGVVMLVLLVLISGYYVGHEKMKMAGFGLDESQARAAVQIEPERLSTVLPGGIGLESSRSVLLLTVRAQENDAAISHAILHVSVISAKGRMESSRDIVTGTDGVAQIPLRFVDFNRLLVTIEATNRVPIVAAWHGHEFEAPFVSETIYLGKSIDVHGIVLQKPSTGELGFGAVGDTERRGITNASITVSPRSPTVPGRVVFVGPLSGWQCVTGPDAQFVISNLPSDWLSSRAMSAAVEAPGFVSQRCQLDLVWSGSNAVQILLEPQVILRGRIVSKLSNQPIAGAHLATSPDGIQVKAVSDSEGRFAIPTLSPGNHVLDIRAVGFARTKVLVKALAGGPESIIELGVGDPGPVDDRPTVENGGYTPSSEHSVEYVEVRIEGDVVDTETELSVPKFAVSQGSTFLGYGFDGRFAWNVSVPVSRPVQLLFRADGFQDAIYEQASIVPGEIVSVGIRLVRKQVLSGIVQAPNGQFAGGAVVLASQFNTVVFDPVEGTVGNVEAGSTHITTDSDGHFSGAVPFGLSCLVICHPTGFAFESIRGDETMPFKPVHVRLKSWASIHGIMESRLAGAQAVSDGGHGSETLFLDIDLSKTRIVDGNSFDWPCVPPLLTTSIYIDGPNGSRLGGNNYRLYPGEAREIELRMSRPRVWRP